MQTKSPPRQAFRRFYTENGLSLAPFPAPPRFFGKGAAPAYRKQGHGKKLMLAAIAHARQEGKEYLELGVTAGNDDARRMYESMGFTVYGRRPGLLKIDGKNYDEYLMILKLQERL